MKIFIFTFDMTGVGVVIEETKEKAQILLLPEARKAAMEPRLLLSDIDVEKEHPTTNKNPCILYCEQRYP